MYKLVLTFFSYDPVSAVEQLISLCKPALSCRDRAEERRKGINPDYAGVQQLLGVIGGGGDVDATRLTVEESKYLGGDIEHTHLVKGLDYALLQKVGTVWRWSPVQTPSA